MKSITYLVHPGCNERCLFCFNHWRETGGMNDISYEEKLIVLEKILSLCPSHLAFSGGEPFFEQKLLGLVAFVRAHAPVLPISIQTNATLLTKDIAQKCKDFGVNYLLISLHGPKEAHNEITRSSLYEQSIRGIQHAVSAGVSVILNTVVTKKNWKCLPLFLRSVSSLGVNAVQLSQVYAAGSALLRLDSLTLSPQEQQQLVNHLQQLQLSFPIKLHAFEKEILAGTSFIADACGTGEDELAVFPNGDVTLCPAWSQVYGNILQDSWETIHNNISQGIAQEQQEKQACTDCGGCFLTRKAVT